MPVSGFPVVLSESGAPFVAVESGAPLATVAENGRGLPIKLVESGAPAIVLQGGGAAVPDIATLFASGEQGFISDSLTSSRLFQDVFKTTAAASDGDAVGLMLDRLNFSNPGAFVAKPELAINGDASNGKTGWLDGTNLTTVAANGRFEITRAGAVSSGTAWRQVISNTSGKTLKVRYKALNASVARNFQNLTGFGAAVKGLGVFTERGPATASTVTLNFYPSADATTTYLDDVSVREDDAFIFEQPDAPGRPLLKFDGSTPYLIFDGTDDTIAGTTLPSAAMTIAVACRLLTPNSTIMGGGSGSNRVLISTNSNGEVSFRWGGEALTLQTGSIIGEDVVLILTGDGTAREVWFGDNRLSTRSPTGTPAGGTGAIALGSDNNGGAPTSFANARVYAAVAINRRLTASEITDVLVPAMRAKFPPPAFASGTAPLVGMNISGGDFAHDGATGASPGILGTDYNYPGGPGTDASKAIAPTVDYLYGRGMRVFRFALLWERLQATVGGPLRSPDYGHVRDFVNYVRTKPGAKIVLDPHNYAKRDEVAIVASGGTTWTQLGEFMGLLLQTLAADAGLTMQQLSDEGIVIPSAVNEPNIQTATAVRDGMLAWEAAIFAAGWRGMRIVTGAAYASIGLWPQQQAAAWASVTPDPKRLIEQHLYMTATGNGGNGTALWDGVQKGKDDIVPGLALTRIINFTLWCRANGHRAFLGEFGGPDTVDSLRQIDGIMGYIRTNRDVWWGMAWYSGGPLWSSGYTYNAQPTGLPDAPVDRAQFSRLIQYV